MSMKKEYTYYFKVIDHELFGGEGTEGYMSMTVDVEVSSPSDVVSKKFVFGEIGNAKVIQIQEDEYLEATEEEE